MKLQVDLRAEALVARATQVATFTPTELGVAFQHELVPELHAARRAPVRSLFAVDDANVGIERALVSELLRALGTYEEAT